MSKAKGAFDVYLEGERLKRLETPSGIPVKEVYTPDDIRGLDYERDLGYPGKYPFTRGVYEVHAQGPVLDDTTTHRIRNTGRDERARVVPV